MLFSFLEPAAFQSHPSSQTVSLDTAVQLSCSFYNFTTISFSWIKDGTLLNEAGLQNLTSSSTQSTGVGIYSGGSLVNHVMAFTVNSPVNQGYYWCRVQDSSNNIVESFKAFIRLKGRRKWLIFMCLSNKMFGHVEKIFIFFHKLSEYLITPFQLRASFPKKLKIVSEAYPLQIQI